MVVFISIHAVAIPGIEIIIVVHAKAYIVMCMDTLLIPEIPIDTYTIRYFLQRNNISELI